MPNWYYEKFFTISDEGHKLGVMMVDSCFLLCSNFSYGHENTYLDDELKELRDFTCEDPFYRDEGNRMIEWIQNRLQEWDMDEKIVWRASVQHHPMFAKWYTDYEHIINNFLPILMDHKFDLYLNGHEHILEYVNYPYE